MGSRVRAQNLKTCGTAALNGRRGTVVGPQNQLAQYAVYFPHLDSTRFLHPDSLMAEVAIQEHSCAACDGLEFDTKFTYLLDDLVAYRGQASRVLHANPAIDRQGTDRFEAPDTAAC